MEGVYRFLFMQIIINSKEDIMPDQNHKHEIKGVPQQSISELADVGFWLTWKRDEATKTQR